MQQQGSFTPEQIAGAPAPRGVRCHLARPRPRGRQGFPRHGHRREVLHRLHGAGLTLALGYNHPEVMEAALAQMQSLPHVRGLPTLPRLQLAKRLADLCPGRLNIVTYAPTGSLGIESAMKLAMINRPAAHRFVTFYQARITATRWRRWRPRGARPRTAGQLRPGREVHAVHAELCPGAEPVLRTAAGGAAQHGPDGQCDAGCAAPIRRHAPARRGRPGGRDHDGAHPGQRRRHRLPGGVRARGAPHRGRVRRAPDLRRDPDRVRPDRAGCSPPRGSA